MKILFIIFLLLACGICRGQNLVLNPSFENYTSCPSAQDQVYNIVGWSSVGGTPDYLNSCSPSCHWSINCVGIPQNIFGFQPAYDGNGYAGLITCTFSNTREYINTRLANPLSIGHRYYVSAYISRADGVSYHGASNNFGFSFSTVFVYPSPYSNISQVHDTIIETDTINWTKVSGSFIADSTYEYMALGNFYDNQHTDTLYMQPDSGIFTNFAYYFVDNICVSEDSLTCNLSDKIISINSQKEIKIFPEPFSEILNIGNETNEKTEIILYDILSRKLLQQEFTNSISLNTSQLASGIYIYKLRNKNGFIKKGKVVKQ